jgi:hypothetical protein
MIGLLLCLPSLLQVSLLPPQHLTAYLELFITLFGYGPSLPELAQDYWSHDVVNETQRTVFVITANTFPLGQYALLLFYLSPSLTDFWAQPDPPFR